MKKKMALIGVFVPLCAVALYAQNIDAQVKQAVDGLVSRINKPIEVSISPVTIAGTDTPTEFSRFIGDKICLSAVDNTRYKVIAPTRGMPPQNSGALKGKITGTYRQEGDSVNVMLSLISDIDNSLLNAKSFLIPIGELEKLCIAILPADVKNEQEAREREKIFTPPIAPSQAASFSIRAWPSSGDRIYYHGENLII